MDKENITFAKMRIFVTYVNYDNKVRVAFH